jgi:hypothetical protein
MADLSITPANVEQSVGAVIRHSRAAAAILAGQTLYDVGDGTVNLADADAALPAGAAARKCRGVALHGAAQGQPIAWQTGGRILIGATVTPGEIYVLSGNAGGICPEADLATGDEVVLIGVGFDADEILLNVWPTGVVVP